MPIDVDTLLSEIEYMETRLSEVPEWERPLFIKAFADEYRGFTNDLVKIVEKLRDGV